MIGCSISRRTLSAFVLCVVSFLKVIVSSVQINSVSGQFLYRLLPWIHWLWKLALLCYLHFYAEKINIKNKHYVSKVFIVKYSKQHWIWINNIRWWLSNKTINGKIITWFNLLPYFNKSHNQINTMYKIIFKILVLWKSLIFLILL